MDILTDCQSNAGRTPRPLKRLCLAARQFLGNEDGVSALEFGLIGPVLVFGMIGMADVGLAVNERMMIDQALRAGAQTAIADEGPEAVEQVLRSAAEMNFTLAGPDVAGSDSLLAVRVRRFCACRTAPELEVTCSTTCTDDDPTQVYYLLTAYKEQDNMILPSSQIAGRLLVESR